MENLKRVLVVSLRNSCRSAMAEGWLKYYGRGAAKVSSAGIEPAKLDLYAANAMVDAVIDISTHQPQGIDQVLNQSFDHIIVLCSEDECKLPEFNEDARIHHRPFGDVSLLELSEDEKKMAYAKLRDEIEDFCFDFTNEHVKSLF